MRPGLVMREDANLAQTEVAVRGKRPHPELSGQRRRPTVIFLRIESAARRAMYGDFAKKVKGPRFVSTFLRLMGQIESTLGCLRGLVVSTGKQVRLAQPRHR